MKIKQYFDLNFLKDVSNDAQLLHKISNEDSGFIFKRLQDCKIFPQKSIIADIDSYASIIFLLKNYQVTNKEYKKYESLLKHDSPLLNVIDIIDDTEKEKIVDMLFSDNKEFINPSVLLNKDDFIKYENLIIIKNISEMKEKYILDSFLSLSKEDIKEIPLSLFSKNIHLYRYSSHYLFNDYKHLHNYKAHLINEVIDFDLKTFLEYGKRVNDMYPYLSNAAKLKVIKSDYAGDFNPQLLTDNYINDKNLLLQYITQPLALRHCLTVKKDMIAICVRKLEFIKKNKDMYLKLEKLEDLDSEVRLGIIENNSNIEWGKIREFKLKDETNIKSIYEIKGDLDVINNKVFLVSEEFNKISENFKKKFFNFLKPNNFFEAKVFSEVTNSKKILIDYITSKFKLEKSKMDFSFTQVPKEIVLYLIEPRIWKKQDITAKETILICAVENLRKEDFYKIFKLVKFNNKDNDLAQKIKDYIIRNHVDKLLYDVSILNNVWKYNIEDLSNIFRLLDDNNNWFFNRNYSYNFSNYVQTAISNSSSEMFWQTIENVKYDSPAIYAMLCCPLSIFRNMKNNNFLYDEFNFFKEDYVQENQNKMSVNTKDNHFDPYIYIYSIVDFDLIAQGINLIRRSMSKCLLKDYEKPSFLKMNSSVGNLNYSMFSIFSQSFNEINTSECMRYIGEKEMKSLIDRLINIDLSNLNIIVSSSYLISLYGVNNLKEFVLKKLNDVEDVNKVFLKEFASSYYEMNGKAEKIACYGLEGPVNEFYNEIFECFSKSKLENALFLSYLCKQSDDFNINIKKYSGIDLKGNFKNLELMQLSSFGSNIHNFAEDFYNSSQLYEKIDSIQIDRSDSPEVVLDDKNFKI